MKSQIRVDYKSRYGDGNFGDKEPLVRIEVEESDDPRDTLLTEIFKHGEIFPRVGCSQIDPPLPGKSTFFIYRRNDSEHMCDLGSHAFTALAAYSGIDAIFVTAHDEFYFELATDSKVRSKGTSRARQYKPYLETGQEKDHEFVKRIVNEWKDFEKIVKESQKKTK